MLHLGGATHGIHGAGEFHQNPVADDLDDPAVVLGDLGVEQLFPEGFQARERTLLVDLHKVAIADHVGGKNGGQPALNALLGHGAVPF